MHLSRHVTAPPKRSPPHPAPARPAARRFLEVEGEQPPLQKARGATAMPHQPEAPPPGLPPASASAAAPASSAHLQVPDLQMSHLLGDHKLHLPENLQQQLKSVPTGGRRM